MAINTSKSVKIVEQFTIYLWQMIILTFGENFKGIIINLYVTSKNKINFFKNWFCVKITTF